ncbi:hypothetical protein NDU88_008213 [Pleurodeles waltl]|uniref:Tektin n=1 Tax=Pleurodeles waltl TaxID=8319 RepID=A0AAV7QP97_PLEWA|nr:hypothetical protein NDU88_008213 [Pleurodeles waltl]
MRRMLDPKKEHRDDSHWELLKMGLLSNRPVSRRLAWTPQEALYQCIMSHREEPRLDIRRAQAATHKLQGVVHKMDKSCATISDRLSDLETRTSALKSDMVEVQGQVDAHEAQLLDVQWKLEDQENCQRRNNLQVLGVAEGEEGSEIRLLWNCCKSLP